MSNYDSLGVETSALNSVGNNMTTVADETRTIFENIEKEVETITSHDAWAGDSSNAFRDIFTEIKPRVLKNLDELKALGPALTKTSTTYSDAEAENVSSINKYNSYRV